MPPAFEVLLLNTTIPQIQAAQTGDTYVVPRDIAFSAALTLSTGTANGVPYLNGSKVVTTGSALTFDGTTLKSQYLNVQDFAASNDFVVGFRTNAGTQVGYLGVVSSANNLSIFSANSLIFNASSSEGMRLTSTGLGIGANNPGEKLSVNATTGATAKFINSVSYGSLIGIASTATGGKEWQLHSTANGDGTTGGGYFNIVNSTDASVPFRLSASGNLGLGVTPSAWGAGWTALQIRSGGASIWTDGASRVFFSSNTFYDGTDRKYVVNGRALEYVLDSGGSHIWKTAASGTAGNAITFTQAMTLDASGNLKVGGTADRATTAGTNHLDIFNGTAPVGTLTNGISIYSSSGEAYVMDAAGNATLFSPHDAETNEWIFKSKHTPTGKVLKIDVERLLKFVNDHFGLDAVHEFVEE